MTHFKILLLTQMILKVWLNFDCNKCAVVQRIITIVFDLTGKPGDTETVVDDGISEQIKINICDEQLTIASGFTGNHLNFISNGTSYISYVFWIHWVILNNFLVLRCDVRSVIVTGRVTSLLGNVFFIAVPFLRSPPSSPIVIIHLLCRLQQQVLLCRSQRWAATDKTPNQSMLVSQPASHPLTYTQVILNLIEAERHGKHIIRITGQCFLRQFIDLDAVATKSPYFLRTITKIHLYNFHMSLKNMF